MAIVNLKTVEILPNNECEKERNDLILALANMGICVWTENREYFPEKEKIKTICFKIHVGNIT